MTYYISKPCTTKGFIMTFLFMCIIYFNHIHHLILTTILSLVLLTLLLIPFFHSLILFHFHTRWILWRPLTGAWVSICLQKHGYLPSGYATEENLSLSSTNRELQINSQGGLSPMIPDPYHDRLLIGSIMCRPCAD